MKLDKGHFLEQKSADGGKRSCLKDNTMTHRLFEGREHAAVYQKYRFAPPGELKEMILQYLDEKVYIYIYTENKSNSLFIYLYIRFMIIVPRGHFNVVSCQGEQNYTFDDAKLSFNTMTTSTLCNRSHAQKGKPHTLAVDLGCGTGQNSRLLAPYFHEVVGIDISECQLREAMAVPGQENVTYR